MGAQVTVGVSLKTYFGHARALAWCGEVAARIGTHPAVTGGAVRVFLIPTYPQLPGALAAVSDTPLAIGAQDVSAHPAGAFTGEVTAAELVELGVRFAEVGHAERRRLFGETDADTAAKTHAALNAGLTPVVCVGETERGDAADAAEQTLTQMRACLADAPAGPVVIAYEPVWAIGAPEPAPDCHIQTVTRAVRSALASDPARAGSAVIYGGSAGPGLLTRLEGSVDGLFLGRFAHDVSALVSVIDEAAVIAATETGRSS